MPRNTDGLAALPPSIEIRARLGEITREARTLRSMLRLALRAESERANAKKPEAHR